MFFSINTVFKNPSEQYEVLRGTFKLGMFYGPRIRTMATLANMKITEAGLVMVDFLCLFLPSASWYDLIAIADEQICIPRI